MLSSRWNRSRWSAQDKVVVVLIGMAMLWIVGIVGFYLDRGYQSSSQTDIQASSHGHSHFNQNPVVTKTQNEPSNNMPHDEPIKPHHVEEPSKHEEPIKPVIPPHHDDQRPKRPIKIPPHHQEYLPKPVEPKVQSNNKYQATHDAINAGDWSHLPNPAVVVLTYNRPTYLRQTLEALSAAAGVDRMSVYVSQDGNQPDLGWIVDVFGQLNVTIWNRNRRPLLTPDQPGTAYLAQHYKWVFDRLFFEQKHSHVIVIEDDMVIAPDFFALMRDGASLMAADPTVWCVSSWHDNGRNGLVYDPYRLFRTNYFPGLGWMLAEPVWRELSPDFPLDQWDYWMRLDTTYKNRSCISPEIARNHNIGQEGTNMGGSFFARYLEPIAQQLVPVATFNRPGEKTLEHMHLRNYDESLRSQLSVAHVLGDITDRQVYDELAAIRDGRSTLTSKHKRFIVTYKLEEYRRIVDLFSLIQNPRSTYAGVSALRVTGAAGVRSVDQSILVDEAEKNDDTSRWIYIVDVRHANWAKHFSSWLDKNSPHHNLVWRPHPHLRMVAGVENESCDAACSKEKLRCEVDNFSVLNECSVLKSMFACENGCAGGVMGPDIPNYVTAASKPEFFQKCLTTEDQSRCDAKHWTAKRLCPCVPF